MVGVLEDQDPVAQVEVEALLAVGVSIVLGDPQAAAPIPAHRDGLTDIRFSGKERGVESLWEV